MIERASFHFHKYQQATRFANVLLLLDIRVQQDGTRVEVERISWRDLNLCDKICAKIKDA